jgi:hypothetical protein
MLFCGDRGGKPIGASSPLQAVNKLTAELHLAHPACTIAEGFLQWKKSHNSGQFSLLVFSAWLLPLLG